MRGRCAVVGIGSALAAFALAACASAPRREAPPSGDRTRDPEFVTAVEAAEHEFENQADALSAGVYEPFVHPDSLRPVSVPTPVRERVVRSAPAPEFGPEDPSTEALLGTLDSTATYNRSRDRPTLDGIWTLQVGAFGAETGTFVRLRQLERDFPDLPRWHVVESGIFRVYLGRFSVRSDAERLLERVVERGYADAWIAHAP